MHDLLLIWFLASVAITPARAIIVNIISTALGLAVFAIVGIIGFGIIAAVKQAPPDFSAASRSLETPPHKVPSSADRRWN